MSEEKEIDFMGIRKIAAAVSGIFVFGIVNLPACELVTVWFGFYQRHLGEA